MIFFKWNGIKHPLSIPDPDIFNQNKDSQGVQYRVNPSAGADGKIELFKGKQLIKIDPSSNTMENYIFNYTLNSVDEEGNKWIIASGSKNGAGFGGNYEVYVIKYDKNGVTSYWQPYQQPYYGGGLVGSVKGKVLLAHAERYLWKTDTGIVYLDYDSDGLGALSNYKALINDKDSTIYAMSWDYSGNFSVSTFHGDGTYYRRGVVGQSYFYSLNDSSLYVYSYVAHKMKGKKDSILSIPSYESLGDPKLMFPVAIKEKSVNAEFIIAKKGIVVKDGNTYQTLLFADHPEIKRTQLYYETRQRLRVQDDSTVIITLNDSMPSKQYYFFTYKNKELKFFKSYKTDVCCTSTLFIGKNHTYFYAINANGIVQITDDSITTYISGESSACGHLSPSQLQADENYLWLNNEASDTSGTCSVARMNHKDYYVKGNVFYDENENGTGDFMEPSYSNLKLKINPSGLIVVPGPLGTYLFKGVTGTNYKVEIIDSSKFSRISRNGYDIGVKLKEEIYELQTGLWLPRNRCSVARQTSLTLVNSGVVPMAKIVVQIVPDKVKLIQNGIPVDTAIITYEGLGVNQSVTIPYDLEWPGGDFTGQTSTIKTISRVYANESLVYTKSDSIQSIIRCSYDPNDKSVTPAGIGSQRYTLKKANLEYQIRFENTGNDTAYHVTVYDTLNSKLDLNTFRFLSSSHSVNTEITKEGVAIFHFNNIMLPDSNASKSGAQGYVRFSVRALANTPENTMICNRAAIVFDQNKAIITNEVCNTLVSAYPVVLGIAEDGVANAATVYPNPTSGWLHIPAETKGYKIYSLVGNEIMVSDENPVNTSRLEQGVYLIRLENKTGKVNTIKFSVLK